MIERIKDLEYKLVTRESRPEDRERISQVCVRVCVLCDVGVASRVYKFVPQVIPLFDLDRHSLISVWGPLSFALNSLMPTHSLLIHSLLFVLASLPTIITYAL